MSEEDNEDEDQSNDEGENELFREDAALGFNHDEVRNVELNPDIEALVTKIRDTAKMFKNSPVSSDTLQKFMKADNMKPRKLILDVKTRW